MITIYSVPSYKKVINECNYIKNNINIICKALKKDFQYHERITCEQLLKFNVDLDYFDNYKQFMYNLIEYMNRNRIFITESDICYTQNFGKKDKKGNNVSSYHVTIPKFHCKSLLMKFIWEDFKKKYNYGNEIDTGHLGVDGSGKWFRLPSQTKENIVNTEHIIQKGEMKDFVLQYIEKESIDLDLYFKFAIPEVKIKKEILNLKIKVNKKNYESNNYSDENLKKLITTKNEYFVKMLLGLKIERFNDYNSWMRMGALVYSLECIYSEFENAEDIFNELSKRCENYSQDGVTKLWNSLNRVCYNIGTLWFYIEEDNIIEDKEDIRKFLQKLNFNSIFNSRMYESIKIDVQYLITGKDDKILTYFDDFLGSNKKTFVLHSNYNTRKSTFIKVIQKKYKFESILIPSYRKSLTYDLHKNFKELGFKNYLDHNIDEPLIIIQLESMLKLYECKKFYKNKNETFIPKYDLVVIDEIESILNHFLSPTFKGSSREVFDLLVQIIINSKKLIVLDGDFSNRGFEFIKLFGETMIIENTYNNNNKTIYLTSIRDTFYKEIKECLDNNKKIVICSMSSKEAEFYQNKINIDYPDKMVNLYTGLTDDLVKEEHFKDVDKYFSEADILIYSPTVLSGLSYDVPNHFYKIFGIIYPDVATQRDYFQMQGRIRHVESSKITILNADNLQIKDSAFYWTYNEILESCKRSRDKILNYIIEKDEDGNVVRKVDTNIDHYTKTQLYNRVEQLNKNSTYFLPYFLEFAKSKNYKLEYDTQIMKEEETDKEKPIDKLLQVSDITDDEYERLLEKQRNGVSTNDDKLKVQKQYYKLLLGVNELNKENLTPYYKKDYLIYNHYNLIDESNLKKTDDFQTELKLKQLRIISSIINTLGFKNCYDNLELNRNTFIENLQKLVQSNVIFTNFLDTCELFGKSKNNVFDFTNSKICISYINSFLNLYSIKLIRDYIPNKRKCQENYIYKLERTHYIEKIVENNINKIKLDKLHDILPIHLLVNLKKE